MNGIDDITIPDVLQSLRPKAEWALVGDKLEWHDKKQTEPCISCAQTHIKTNVLFFSFFFEMTASSNAKTQ